MAIRQLFCQVEAVGTAIWLTERAPKKGKCGTNLVGGISGGEGRAYAGEYGK